MNHFANLQSREGSPAPPCILVVDDDPAIRALYSEILSDEGYGVQTAENGREAIVQVKAQPTDLIMMDIMMPIMDGLTACTKIKADPAMQGVPIVIMSAGINLRRHADDFACMAAAILSKPIDLDYLLDTVKRFV
jgi:CheY-like chemotaxis protein